MINLDIPGIVKKLAGMSRRMDLLKKYDSLSLEDYLNLGEEQQATIERFLEIIIQAALDINKMLLTQVSEINLRSGDEPVRNTDIFRLAGENGFIPLDLAEQLAKSGQFRNVLAHLYDDVDPQQVYIALQKSFEQYPLYIEAIENYLDSMEGNNA